MHICSDQSDDNIANKFWQRPSNFDDELLQLVLVVQGPLFHSCDGIAVAKGGLRIASPRHLCHGGDNLPWMV